MPPKAQIPYTTPKNSFQTAPTQNPKSQHLSMIKKAEWKQSNWALWAPWERAETRPIFSPSGLSFWNTCYSYTSMLSITPTPTQCLQPLDCLYLCGALWRYTAGARLTQYKGISSSNCTVNPIPKVHPEWLCLRPRLYRIRLSQIYILS